MALATGGIMAFTVFAAAPASACHCQTLEVTPVDRTTFQFTSGLDTLGGGNIEKVVYSFGDGTTAEKASSTEAVSHQYTHDGTFTAQVTIFLRLNGELKELTGANCIKPIEVQPAPPTPSFECTALAAKVIERNKFSFTATSEAKNGAVLVDANFDFGDNQTDNNVKPSSDEAITASHQYAKDGSYKVTATLNFKVGDDVKSVTCATTIVVNPEVCAFNPAMVAGSPDCKPPVPPQTPQPPVVPPTPAPAARVVTAQLPKELPSTGPADLASSGLGLGSIVGAGTYYLRSRKNLKS
jgi:PKD repeat protein